MYKSKKQNYPGLYGTFRRIDEQNISEIGFKPLKHDYENDENLESLDILIQNIKKRSHTYAQEIIRERTSQKTPLQGKDDTFVLEKEMEELKKHHDFFQDPLRPQHIRLEPEHGAFKPTGFDEAIVSDEYIEQLEHDLLRNIELPQEQQTISSSSAERSLHRLKEAFEAMSPEQREQLKNNPDYRSILRSLSD